MMMMIGLMIRLYQLVCFSGCKDILLILIDVNYSCPSVLFDDVKFGVIKLWWILF